MNADAPGDSNKRHRKTSVPKRIRNVCESARQIMQPAPVRIPAPSVYDGLSPSGTDADTQEDKGSSEHQPFTLALRTLATVATAVWRAKTTLDSESQAELPHKWRNLPRHV